MTSNKEQIVAEVKQLISFTVGAEEYGIELLRVKEVIRTRQITWLPKAPACVKGIINLRGAHHHGRRGEDSQSASTR